MRWSSNGYVYLGLFIQLLCATISTCIETGNTNRSSLSKGLKVGKSLLPLPTAFTLSKGNNSVTSLVNSFLLDKKCLSSLDLEAQL